MNTLYATKWQRFVAYIIDIAFVSVVASLFVTLIYYFTKYDTNQRGLLQKVFLDNARAYLNNPTSANQDALYSSAYDFLVLYAKETLRSVIMKVLVATIYLVLIPLCAPNFQTLGRIASRTKVVKTNGNVATASNLLVREYVGTLLIYSTFIGLIISMILVLTKGKSICDYISKTVLIKKTNMVTGEAPKEEIKEEPKNDETKNTEIRIYTDDEILNEDKNK